MKLGVYAPQFRQSPEPALAVARRAEAVSLDGVFLFDHLWPMGQTSGPALSLFPMLGAIAAATTRITVGTLAARVDLMDASDLVESFLAAQQVAGERLIAGLAIGDRVTRPEDDEYGVLRRPYEARLELLDDACDRLQAEGIAVWLAGSSDQVRDMAERYDVPMNLWQPDAAKLAAARRPFSWGGIVSGSADEIAVQLAAPLRAHARWAVCGPAGGADQPGALERLTQARAALG